MLMEAQNDQVVVEDEEESLKSYVRVLSKAKFDVTPFASGREALKNLEQDRDVDLVVTDLRMPEIDGIGVLKRVKEIDPGIEVVCKTLLDPAVLEIDTCVLQSVRKSSFLHQSFRSSMGNIELVKLNVYSSFDIFLNMSLE